MYLCKFHGKTNIYIYISLSLMGHTPTKYLWTVPQVLACFHLFMKDFGTCGGTNLSDKLAPSIVPCYQRSFVVHSDSFQDTRV